MPRKRSLYCGFAEGQVEEDKLRDAIRISRMRVGGSEESAQKRNLIKFPLSNLKDFEEQEIRGALLFQQEQKFIINFF